MAAEPRMAEEVVVVEEVEEVVEEEVVVEKAWGVWLTHEERWGPSESSASIT